MKRRLLRCAYFFLCAVLLVALAACGREPDAKEPDVKEPDPLESTDPSKTAEPVTAPKIAISCWTASADPAIDWYYADATQLRYGGVPREEMLFEVDVDAALAGLADGTYDVAILPGTYGETPDFAGCSACPLLNDAVVFVHGNPTPPNPDYDLALETIRTIYGSGGEFYWDEEETEPLIPTFWFDELAQPLAAVFDINATAEDIFSSEGYDNPIWAVTDKGLDGSALFPVYYSFLSGEAGINGAVISVDGIFPSETTIASGAYPLRVTFYAVYPAGDQDAARLAAALQIMA